MKLLPTLTAVCLSLTAYTSAALAADSSVETATETADPSVSGILPGEKSDAPDAAAEDAPPPAPAMAPAAPVPTRATPAPAIAAAPVSAALLEPAITARPADPPPVANLAALPEAAPASSPAPFVADGDLARNIQLACTVGAFLERIIQPTDTVIDYGGGTGLLKASTVLAAVLIAVYVVSVWAMGGKPS